MSTAANAPSHVDSLSNFPSWHAATGNLPVLSLELHAPVDGSGVGAHASTEPTEWELVTGNLPVLSKELERGVEHSSLWVELTDPFTLKVRLPRVVARMWPRAQCALIIRFDAKFLPAHPISHPPRTSEGILVATDAACPL